MAERSLPDRVLGHLENHGPVSAILELAHAIEADRARLDQLEQMVPAPDPPADARTEILKGGLQ